VRAALARPSFHLSDLWSAPLHGLPLRDQILYDTVTIRRDMKVLELGPGTGFTAYRLSRQVRHLTVVDVPGNAGALQKALGELPNVEIVAADACRPGLEKLASGPFDLAFGLAVFDLLPDPAQCLHNLASTLRRGGRLLLQFPNYFPPRNSAVTFFRTMDELAELLRPAGFDAWSVYGIRLRRYASFVTSHLHDRPLALLRRLRRSGPGAALTYDRTWVFANRSRLERCKPLVHAASAMLSAALDAGGRWFEYEPLGEAVANRNLLLIAQSKGGDA